MPPLPKPRAQRARTNRKAGASILTLAPTSLEDVPAEHHTLPPGSWRAATVAWWADVVASPMAGEWTEVDWHGLRRLAVLVDTFERGFAALSDGEFDAKDMVACAKVALTALAEIRLQGALYGLTPIDRARLHWELDKGDRAAADRASRSRPVAVAKARPDPRVARKARG